MIIFIFIKCAYYLMIFEDLCINKRSPLGLGYVTQHLKPIFSCCQQLLGIKTLWFNRKKYVLTNCQVNKRWHIRLHKIGFDAPLKSLFWCAIEIIGNKNIQLFGIFIFCVCHRTRLQGSRINISKCMHFYGYLMCNKKYKVIVKIVTVKTKWV